MHKTKSITYVGYRITERCNRYCPFCFAREKEIAPDQSLEEIDKFLQNLKRAGITAIGVMGGEPLVRQDIVEVLQLIKKYDFESILSTNATLITDILLDKIKNLIDFMSVSLDGYSSGKNDVFRGPNQFESAVRMISRYNPCRHKFKLKINTIIHKLNIRDIDKIPVFFQEKPIIWKLLQYTPRLDGKKVKDKFEISLEQFIKKAAFLKNKWPKVKIAIRTYTIDEKYDLLVLRPNGDLEINYKEDYKVVGNAYKDEIKDVIAKVWKEEVSYYSENWDEFEKSYR